MNGPIRRRLDREQSFIPGSLVPKFDSLHLQVVHFLGVLVVEAFAFELVAGGIILGPAEGNDVVAEGAERGQKLKGGGIGATVPFGDGGRVAGGEELGEVVGHGATSLGELGGVATGGPRLLKQDMAGMPFAKTALAPVGQVGLVDGAITETGGEDSADVGVLIEPDEEVGAEFAIGEAMIELFANGGGKTGDFAVAGFHNPAF